ncbi:MAG: GGDEF domain-containing protein [Myxococcales bacterium]|nr:GGDEF domain-containing protein [Myxococcales bacterium]
MRTVYKLIMPGGLVVLGAFLCLQGTPSPEVVPPLARFVPAAIFAIGAVLALRFQDSQMVLALILLALADLGLAHFGRSERLATELGRDVLTGMALLLPLNFAVLCVTPNRGILTASTVSRFVLILCQPLLMAWACLKWPGAIASVLDLQWAPVAIPGSGLVTQPGWVAFAGTFALLPAQHLFPRSAMVGGLLWALFAVLLALNADLNGIEPIVYLTAAGVLLIVSQVESSYLLVFRDDLTELPSRRALNQALMRLGKHYTIAMVDIDHFKKFNDTYGHQIGDQLLRMVGSKLAVLGGGGTAFRYGGEEFTLLFPGKRPEQVMTHIEGVLRTIRNTPFTIRGAQPSPAPGKPAAPANPRAQQKVGVTVSIGVAAARTPAEVVGDADRALYRAKETGRNRIVSLVAGSGRPAPERPARA